MATSTFSVRYKPLRIGFLVGKGSVEEVVRASGFNTLLWGGIHNPIIPVSVDLDFARQLIRLFNVEILCALNKSKEMETLLKEYQYLKSPHYFDWEILHEDWRTKKQVIGYLDVINILDFYYEKEIRNRPRKFRSNCTLIEWDEKDPLSNLFAITFGRFPKALNLEHDYTDRFLKALRAKKIILRDNKRVMGKLTQTIWPLMLTADRLYKYGTNFCEGGFYIGYSYDFDDLVSFWNLRAAGLNLQFLPVDSRRLDSFVLRHLANIDTTSNHILVPKDFICVYFRDSKGAEAQLRKLKIKKEILPSKVDEVIWNGLNIKPADFYFEHNHILGNVDYKFDKYSVSIALPEKPFRKQHGNLGSQNIASVISPITEFEYAEHTLTLPLIHELNEFFSRQITFDPWKLRTNRQGIALIQKVYESVVRLYPLPHVKLIEKIFDYAEIQAQMNQAGRLAYRIIQQMQEYDPLEACRVFKIRGVRALIKDLPSGQTIKYKDALQTIGCHCFDKFKRLFIETRMHAELTPQDVWCYLIKKRIFTPALSILARLSVIRKKKSFRCTYCGLESMISYRNFAQGWTCGFCGHEDYLPPFIPNAFRKKQVKIWNFRKSRMFSQDNNQEGALPVILTLLQIKRQFHDSNFIYSTPLSLKPKKGHLCETDIVILNYSKGNNVEIGIGECKSDGGKIDEDDILKLKNIRKHFMNKGLRCYLIFSKTCEGFTENEIGFFKQLTNEHIYPILFTRKELEPYEPYEEYRESKLPRPYALNLEDMAINSNHIYLQ